jgi:2-dehydropantoate 2-reductase
LPIETATTPNQVAWKDGDVVLLTMKSQDTAAALDALVDLVPRATPVVCVQNGVANERMALERFANVYGVCVMCPTTYLDPGVVQAYSAPTTGIMDVGRYPTGTDAVARDIAAAFSGSTYLSDARPDIMRTKYYKLLTNLANVIEATCGPPARAGRIAGRTTSDARADLAARVRAEGAAVLSAAGIDVCSDEEDAARRGDHLRMHPIGGQRRGGGSTWQSFARGTRAIETDYLNGEIVLLGREHRVPTPVNEMLQGLAHELALAGARPGSMSARDVLARLNSR